MLLEEGIKRYFIVIVIFQRLMDNYHILCFYIKTKDM